MGVLLVPLEGGVAGLGPAPRVVGVAVGPADVVDPLDRLVRRLQDHVEVLHLVHDAELAALLAGAVVRQQHDDGVVEHAEALEVVDEPADLVRRCARGRRRTPPGAGPPGAAGSRAACPTARRRDCGGRARCRGAAGPSRPGGRTTARGPRPIPRRTCPRHFVQVLGRSLVRGVHGAEGQVGEERPVGPDGHRVVDEPDGVVDQVLAQVVALLRGGRGLDVVVVVDEVGGELVGLALEEPVEAVEAALQRPLVEGAGRRRVLHGAQVPLAHRERGVPLVTEDLGHRRGVMGDVPAHVGVAAVEVGDGAHADGVVVAAGEQRGPGGRAQRGDVEVGVAQPVGRQGVDVGGG